MATTNSHFKRADLPPHHNSLRSQLKQQQQTSRQTTDKPFTKLPINHLNPSSSLRRRGDVSTSQRQKSPSHRSIVRSRSNGNVEELPITLPAASAGMKVAESVQSVLHAVDPFLPPPPHLATSTQNKNDENLLATPNNVRKASLTRQPYSDSNIVRRAVQEQQKNEADEDEEIVRQHVKITDDDGDEDDDDEEDDEQENRSRTVEDKKAAARRLLAKKQQNSTAAVAEPPPVYISLTTSDSLLTQNGPKTTSTSSSPATEQQNEWPASQSPLLQLLRRSSNLDSNNKSPKYFANNLVVSRHHHRHRHQKSSVGNGGAIMEDSADAVTPQSRRKNTTTTHRVDHHSSPRRTTHREQQQHPQQQQVYTLGLSHHQTRQSTQQQQQQNHYHQSLMNSSSAPLVSPQQQQQQQLAGGLPQPNPAPPKSGMEKYEKLDKIGSGSYGSVYKCRNRETGEQVAIKKFFESEDDPAIRKIAYREIRVLKQLNHENIVNLMEVFRKKKKLHLVFEYCDTTLLDHMEHVKSELGGVSLQDAKKIMFQVLLALRYIHGHNFIHRDIKPENILLVVPSLTVKLCDFGFARLMNRFNPGEEQFTEYVATRWYRSPELLAGDPYYGPGVDIWAVGCVFPEVVTTQPLFPGQTDTDQLYLIQACLGEYKTQRIKFKSPNEGGARFPSAEKALELRLKSLLPAKAVRWISRALTLDASQRPDAETLLRDTFMEDIYKQFEDRWNAQTAAAARAAQQRTLTRVGSGGHTNNTVNLATERSPSRSERLPELPTRTSQQQQQFQQQPLMVTSSETLAVAAKFLGTDRLPGILNHSNNKPVM